MYAMDLLLLQYCIRQLGSREHNPRRRPCTGGFTGAYGLPSSHEMNVIIAEQRVLTADLGHQHWTLPEINGEVFNQDDSNASEMRDHTNLYEGLAQLFDKNKVRLS